MLVEPRVPSPPPSKSGFVNTPHPPPLNELTPRTPGRSYSTEDYMYCPHAAQCSLFVSGVEAMRVDCRHYYYQIKVVFIIELLLALGPY